MRSQLIIVLLVTAWCSEAYVLDPRRRTRPVACAPPPPPAVVPTASRSSTTTARYNFLQDLLGSAFENDSSLSKVDKLDGMLDEGVVEEVDRDRNARVSQLTSTQQQWREKVLSAGTVQSVDLEGSQVEVDFYLAGIPNKDPSNDLFGSKTNISSRDRVVGLTLPTKPSVAGVTLSFESNSVCRVVSDATGFCVVTTASTGTDTTGEWKLSDSGRQIRFRVRVTGYTRTIQTTGTIQKVYWSDNEEKSTRTSTVYTIPEGWMYGESEVTKPAGKTTVQWTGDGVLKLEVAKGLLGASSRMIPCGKFSTRPLL